MTPDQQVLAENGGRSKLWVRRAEQRCRRGGRNEGAEGTLGPAGVSPLPCSGLKGPGGHCCSGGRDGCGLEGLPGPSSKSTAPATPQPSQQRGRGARPKLLSSHADLLLEPPVAKPSQRLEGQGARIHRRVEPHRGQSRPESRSGDKRRLTGCGMAPSNAHTLISRSCEQVTFMANGTWHT